MSQESLVIGILVGICFGLTLVCMGCLVLSILSYSSVKGFENSTHRIEYIDPTDRNSILDDMGLEDKMRKTREAMGFDDYSEDQY